MASTNATKEALAIEFSTLGAYISLHTSDPTTTGGGEATGGSPAYARKQTTWAAGASDGVVTGSQVTFDVGSGNYGWVGIWTAASGGTFISGAAISAINLSAQGQILITPTYTQS